MSKKILIIEDDTFFRGLISKKMLSEGFNVLQAQDGDSGLEQIRKEKPDLVLLDLLLPGVNGFEILAKIKEEGNPMPVLILSNLGQEEDIQKGMHLGANGYLIKSQYNVEEIIEKVKSAVNKK